MAILERCNTPGLFGSWRFSAAQNSAYYPYHYNGICFYSRQLQKLSERAHRPLRGLIRSLLQALTECLTGQNPTHKVQVLVLKTQVESVSAKTQVERETYQCITFYIAALCYYIGWEISKCLPWLGCENYSLMGLESLWLTWTQTFYILINPSAMLKAIITISSITRLVLSPLLIITSHAQNFSRTEINVRPWT